MNLIFLDQADLPTFLKIQVCENSLPTSMVIFSCLGRSMNLAYIIVGTILGGVAAFGAEAFGAAACLAI